eukprot:TRINITY_DN3802_c0_g3_i1.p1 TRINITY_DN3802_c0_g3~~TRINITY_DN3802_c0_g3_i1.p1  ORF type:complete len:1021 (-),score=283.23 TRINITY_DN3802_c0_g3_i1:236-2935(-)
MTEIGERGVNVSGGQKQRISIARAVYADADVVILDDPLSALDAHVAKQVFENCVCGSLSAKTRIMVTNQLHFLPAVDWVVLMKGGKIVEQGTFDELLAKGKQFAELMESSGSVEEVAEDEGSIRKGAEGKKDTGAGEKKASSSVPMATAAEKKAGTKLVTSEERETGVVSLAVFWRYTVAMGGVLSVSLLFVLYILIEVFRIASSWWLTLWSGSADTSSHSVSYYITGYAIICVVQVLISFANQFWLAFSTLKAAKTLHEAMLSAVLRAPMVFFHTNPLGRLINRFTKDTTDIDRNLGMYAGLAVGALFQLLSTFCIIGALNPLALWAIIPLLLVFYFVYSYFQTTAREVKRLDAITRSPVYAQFSEALNGQATIRAYHAMPRLEAANGRTMDVNIRYTLVNMGANRWMAIRLEFLGGLMIFATACFAILDVQRAHDQAAKAASMGLLLSYALTITTMMTMVLRLASMAENSFNAVERVGAFADIESEAPPIIPDHRPPPGWPTEGSVVFDNVVMRYRADLPPVLRGFSALVKGGERVGVVGRTGAGKSSLFGALFRTTEIESGKISIDGCDLREFGLTDVRRALMIIPQTPVLFTGSIRFNLDPFAERTDAEVWEALERAHLKDVVSRLSNGLETEVTEGGDNMSVGQRQLLALARALLRRAKILVLDEATAAVDVGTDALIQTTIRSQFHSTMLVIAHRLNTIIDSDKVLVLDAGQAIEFDTPAALVSNEETVFAGMVASTGPTNAKYLQRIALGELDVKAELAKPAAEEVQRMQKASKSARMRWATATHWALARSLSTSRNDHLQLLSASDINMPPLLLEIHGAANTLHSVLSGGRQEEISAALQAAGIEEEKWWASFLRLIQGLATLGRQMAARLHYEALEGTSEMSRLALTGEE